MLALYTGKIPGTGVRDSDWPCNDTYLPTYQAEPLTSQALLHPPATLLPACSYSRERCLVQASACEFYKPSSPTQIGIRVVNISMCQVCCNRLPTTKDA